MKTALVACVVCTLVVLSTARECVISADCRDPEGRSVCYNQECHKDVYCNKDNDCFFWGAADVAHNFPHPKCYDHPEGPKSRPGYGICMLVEYADHRFPRIMGGDVENLKKMNKNID